MQGRIVLHQYRAPHKETRTYEDIVVMNLSGNEMLECDSNHKGGRIFKDLKLERGERAVITSLKMTWCANGTNREVHLEVQDMFAPREGKSLNHPEVSGIIRLIVPANHVGPVPKQAQKVYYANFLNVEGVTLVHYLGMEHSILNARSSAIASAEVRGISCTETAFQVFFYTDPLLVFILDHKKLLWKGSKQIKPHDIVQCKENPKYYKVSTRIVEEAQQNFKQNIFPLFCYTHPEHKMRLIWDPDMEAPPEMPPHTLNREDREQTSGLGIVYFRLEMECIIVTNQMQAFSVDEINLI